MVGIDESARIILPIGLLDNWYEFIDRQVPRGQQQRIEPDPEFTPGAADQGRFGNLRNVLDDIIELGGDPTQHILVIVFGMKGQGQDGHVIDGMGLDERLGDVVGNPVKVGSQLLIEPHNCGLEVGADIKTDD